MDQVPFHIRLLAALAVILSLVLLLAFLEVSHLMFWYKRQFERMPRAVTNVPPKPGRVHRIINALLSFPPLKQ